MTHVSERQARLTEDESADPVGDGHADADLARRLVTTPGAVHPGHPGRDPVQPDEREPPVEPDRQDGLPDDGSEDAGDGNDSLGGAPVH